jgi:riboflavin transporter FmnP
MIITGIFYLWIYLNLSKHTYVPDYMVYFILGTIITLFFCFLLNLFFKLSLHAAAISGLITGLYFIKNQYQFNELSFSLLGNAYLINTVVVLLLLIIISGVIGTSRLILNEHNNKELYWGYGIGIISMTIAKLLIW